MGSSWFLRSPGSGDDVVPNWFTCGVVAVLSFVSGALWFGFMTTGNAIIGGAALVLSCLTLYLTVRAGLR